MKPYLSKLMTMTALALSFGLPQLALAGAEDFHSMIVESQQAKKDLSQKLQKNVESIEASNLEDSRARRERVVLSESDLESENIAVPSKALKRHSERVGKMASKIDRANLQRVSQEIEANSN